MFARTIALLSYIYWSIWLQVVVSSLIRADYMGAGHAWSGYCGKPELV